MYSSHQIIKYAARSPIRARVKAPSEFRLGKIEFLSWNFFDFLWLKINYGCIGLFTPYLRVSWQRRIRLTVCARNSKKRASGHLFWIWCIDGSPRSALSVDAQVGCKQPYSRSSRSYKWICLLCMDSLMGMAS